MLDKNKIGHNFPTFTVTVERRWLRSFAKAIGESNPIYMDENAACEAGYRTLPAPPTFAMALDQESSEFLPFVPLLDIDISKVLHASQEFEYLEPICAGDTIQVASKIADIFEKKSGLLDFIVMENTYTNQNGDLAVRATSTLVVRNT